MIYNDICICLVICTNTPLKSYVSPENRNKRLIPQFMEQEACPRGAWEAPNPSMAGNLKKESCFVEKYVRESSINMIKYECKHISEIILQLNLWFTTGTTFSSK